MKKVLEYFRTLVGMFQHLIAIVIVILLFLSLIPGYYEKFYMWFLLLVVFQMVISSINLRIVNLFLETVFLVLLVLGIIPYGIGWVFRFIAVPVVLIDLASFNKGAVFQKVEIFTKESVKERYSDFKDKKRSNSQSKKHGDDKVIDVDFKEK